MTRLLPRPQAAYALLAASVAVFATLAVLVHDRSDNRLDRAIYVRVQDHVPDAVVGLGLHLTEPGLVVVLIACVAAWAALRRRWDVVVLAVVVPVTSVLLVEHVFKPWVHRTDTGYLAFPSGHETGVASFACVAGVAMLCARISPARKLVGTALLALHVVLAAVGLVGGGWHYTTDTVGSLALCATVTVTVALVLDAIGRREPAPPVHPVVRNAQSGQATL